MLNKTVKVVKGRRKRLGRGYGSGKGGHTVGKGQKGQKTRSKIGVLFGGVKVKKSLIKRLPFLRGKNKFKSRSKPIAINIKLLESFPAGSVIDENILIKNGLVKKSNVERCGVKILGNSKVTKRYVVRLPISRSASEKIIAAGGTVG